MMNASVQDPEIKEGRCVAHTGGKHKVVTTEWKKRSTLQTQGKMGRLSGPSGTQRSPQCCPTRKLKSTLLCLLPELLPTPLFPQSPPYESLSPPHNPVPISFQLKFLYQNIFSGLDRRETQLLLPRRWYINGKDQLFLYQSGMFL